MLYSDVKGGELRTMGATIVYSPVKSRRNVKSGGSTTWDQTRNIFGDNPILTDEHLPILRALCLGTTFDSDYWGELVALVEKHGAIQLDAEY